MWKLLKTREKNNETKNWKDQQNSQIWAEWTKKKEGSKYKKNQKMQVRTLYWFYRKQKIIIEYYKQLYDNKWDSLDERDKSRSTKSTNLNHGKRKNE